MSSILQTKEDFFGKPEEDQTTALLQELDDLKIDLLVLMFCDFSGDVPRRQLAWICRSKELSKSLLKFLEEEDGTLQVKDTIEKSSCTDNDYVLVEMNQGNTKASRKQVAPIIMEFFKKQ